MKIDWLNCLTDIVVPFGAQIGVIGQTAFEDVEAEIAARFQVGETLARRTRRHPHHGLVAFRARLQLPRPIRAVKEEKQENSHNHFRKAFIKAQIYLSGRRPTSSFITFQRFNRK